MTKQKLQQLPPDPEEMNEGRSESIHRAIKLFAADAGERGPGLEGQNLTDMICNIGHFCDRHDLRLSELIRMAGIHYNAETSHAGKQFDGIETDGAE